MNSSKAMIFILMMGFGMLISACDSESLQDEPTAEGHRFIQNWEGDSPAAKDDFSLNSAVFKGNKLELSVSYSGGCRDHSFTVYSSSKITLSLPPGLTMWAVHDGNGDMCEAYVTETIQFDLSPLIADINGAFWASMYPAESSESVHIEYPGP